LLYVAAVTTITLYGAVGTKFIYFQF